MRDEIDGRVFPAYTLSAEVMCCASQSTDVTKLSECGNDNVFFSARVSVYKEQIRSVPLLGNVCLRGV